MLTMKNWTSRRIVICLLGILLGMGMTLSAVQASHMAFYMALAGDVTPDGCDGCGDTGKTGNCQSVCASSLLTIPPLSSARQAGEFGALLFPDRFPIRSTAIPPDPHPPRPVFSTDV